MLSLEHVRTVSSKGFTLIEVMIVVAIIGLIAALALPSYQGQLRDTRRADCQAVMLQARQALERYYTKRYTYVGATLGANPNDVFPSRCPADAGAGNVFYNLTLPVLTATNFTISAAPVGAQAGDNCGTLAITSVGMKTASGGTVAACWQ